MIESVKLVKSVNSLSDIAGDLLSSAHARFIVNARAKISLSVA